ncbi:MAG: hypothetical protein RIC56_06975 [Pseudomonadales bacterium]
MRPTRRAWVLGAALPLVSAVAAAAPDPATTGQHPLAAMTMTLTPEQPYRFVLAYHGPTMEFRGFLCYGFAGYNETCLKPRLDWLTPASEIELYAPGGVPRDLLEGYVMLVRFPDLSERTFRYRLREPT